MQRPAWRHAAPVLVAVLLPVAFYGATLEDAHITYRYARHLGEGHGLGIWNIGEPPIEGATSLAWTLLLGAATAIGMPIIAVSKLLGWTSYVAMVALCAVNAGRAAFLTPLAWLLALYLPLSWYAVSGMESMLFALVLLLLLLAPHITENRRCTGLTVVASILLPLIRPEGAFFVLAVNGLRQLRERPVLDPRTASGLGLLAGLASIVGLTLFRLLHYGDPVPNTYYAKAAGGLALVGPGLGYLFGFLKATAPVWLAILVAVFAGPGRRAHDAGMLLVVLAAFMVYVVKVGGDPYSAFPLFRHFIHAAPVWLMLAALCLAALLARPVRASLAAGAMAVAASAGLLLGWEHWTWVVEEPRDDLARYGPLVSRPPEPLVGFVAGLSGPDALVAVSLAGRLPYYVPGRFIDMLGLNDRHIARHGRRLDHPMIDSKTDMAYVFGRQPDIIDGYMSGAALVRNVCPPPSPRDGMLRAMLAESAFRDGYLFVRNAPYESLDRAIFVSTAHAARIGDLALDLVPVRETALYTKGCLSR